MNNEPDAFERTSVTRVPQDYTSRPFHIEVHHRATSKTIATVEHMDLSLEETVAVHDLLEEEIPALKKKVTQP